MLDFLPHLLLPKESNNYRAKILHHKILFIFVVTFFLLTLLTTTARANFPGVLGISTNITLEDLLKITNKDRQDEGLAALRMSDQLSEAAKLKAADMFARDYWAHNSPDGTTPWVFVKKAGYNYVFAGENLARGFTTASDTVSAWMASPSHKENMLSPNYTDVGFAIEKGKLNGEETILVVEMFGNKKSETVNVQSQGEQHTLSMNTNPTSLAKSGLSMEKPLIDSISVTRNTGVILLLFFIFVLLLDMIIIERKKIVRLVGHNIDHILFFGMLTLVAILIGRGFIL